MLYQSCVTDWNRSLIDQPHRLALHDNLDDRAGKHMFKSLILGAQGPYVGLPSHSFLSYLGPDVHILMLDCR